MYRMVRVFCATARELEAERRAFHEVVAAFNEAEAMRRGLLYVPVSLTACRDKRQWQGTVDDSIRDSSHFILAPAEDWGPPERDFEREYALARLCKSDPGSPMLSVDVMLRILLDSRPPGIADDLLARGIPYGVFRDVDEFRVKLQTTLSAWLRAASAPEAGAA
jgi:hypothetical protein